MLRGVFHKYLSYCRYTFIGKHLVNDLLAGGHEVTIASRGTSLVNFGKLVSRIMVNRTDAQSIKLALSGILYDVVFDNLAYCSIDMKYVLNSISCKKYVIISTTSVYDKHML